MSIRRSDISDDQVRDAVAKTPSWRKAAGLLGVSEATVRRRMQKLGIRPTLPTGTSTLYGPDGEVKLQWVKEKPNDDEQRIREVIEDMAKSLPRLKASPPPKRTQANLLNLYTMTDCHMGMLAWRRETGADWDLSIAERTLTGCFIQMLDSAPAARVGIVNQLGDWLHSDGLLPVTPTSGHVLDQDGRFSKIVSATIRVLRRLIDASLQKHEQVHVILAEGNHDMASSIWLREMFTALYENEPRVSIDRSVLPFYAYQHGQTLLAFHHGHLVKNASLPLLIAAKFPEMWGATTKRYCHTGHRHHVEEKEHPGIKMIQHPTLAAPDAHSARGGWMSEREATAITYSDKFGQVARTTVTPEMIEQ